MPAIDLAQPITAAMIPAMKAAGIEAVCRYLSNSPAKNATKIEGELLAAAGIRLVLVWEAAGDNYANSTAGQGFTDATRAIAEAQALGVPKGSCIYFCGDDFDATDEQIAAGITSYMRVVKMRMQSAGYGTGVYGNGACCKAMLASGLADKAWVWGALGTNGTRDFIANGNWSIRQHPTVNEFGASVDPDDVRGEYGGFFLVPPPAEAAPPPKEVMPPAATPQPVDTPPPAPPPKPVPGADFADSEAEAEDLNSQELGNL